MKNLLKLGIKGLSLGFAWIVVATAVTLKFILQVVITCLEGIGELCYVGLINRTGEGSPFGIYVRQHPPEEREQGSDSERSKPITAEENVRTKLSLVASNPKVPYRGSRDRVNLKSLKAPVEMGWIVSDPNKGGGLREETNRAGIRRLVNGSSGMVVVTDLATVEALNE